MFGYIVVNRQELRIKEYDRYRAYYCGLCKTLQSHCGIRGQLSLSYDMTFLAVLLSGLYEPEQRQARERCIVHPAKKHIVLYNEIMDYVADMTLLLAWYKCQDDYIDERKLNKACYGRMIHSKTKQICKQYSRQAETVKKQMQKLSELEKAGSTDLDAVSGCFGTLLGEIFVYLKDEWEQYLRNVGFYIGKYVYLIDAYDDMDQDAKKDCYNILKSKNDMPGFDDWIKELRVLLAASFAKEFEKLPIIENVEILRNIIYSGIWTRYQMVRNKREGKTDEESL